MKQRIIKHGPESRQRIANRRLGQVEPLRRATNASRFMDSEKDLDEIQIDFGRHLGTSDIDDIYN